MKRYFQNIDIECWVLPGRELRSADPCVCVSRVTPESCVAVFLRALEELETEGSPSKRTLTFKPSQRPKSISTLRLRLVTEDEQFRVMNISRANATVTIEMTLAGLEIVRDAVIAWDDGAEDFGISPENADLKERQLGTRDLTSGELWFWGPKYDP